MNSDRATADRPTIRYRPGVAKPERARKPSRRVPEARDGDLRVVLDMPAVLPVSPTEIAIIENYLADRIDLLLARCAS